MLKHKGFPSRLRGTDFQFTIRHDNKKGATKLVVRERFADRYAPHQTTRFALQYGAFSYQQQSTSHVFYSSPA
jgi:hypothetical protein